MAGSFLSAGELNELFKGGMAALKGDVQRINDLNVFPVPDGDTGSNMLMTIEGAVKAVAQDPGDDVDSFTKKLSRGALLGARGNSGIILSQFIKGFANGCEEKKELTVSDFIKAMRSGVDRAYQAVITPTEGTVLTVMREGCEYLESPGITITNFQDCFSRLNKTMSDTLKKTPEMLDVLREAGVIDSGGAGFLCIFVGMEKVLNGEKIEGNVDFEHASSGNIDTSLFNADSELIYGYCTEFILQLQNKKTDIPNFDIKEIVDYLETIGNSIVAIMDGDLVKVHVHTFTPGEVLNFGQKYGEFVTLKIENMSVQHNETSFFREQEKNEAKKAEHKPIAVVAALSGPGIKEYFTELGVDEIVDGGQTDNPSTADFLKAFDKLDADHIIVLPCNSNIVMAAQQAAGMYDKAQVHVVEAKSIAEGYSALSMMDPTGGDVDKVLGDMNANISNARTGLITTAIRDVDYDDLTVKKGQYIGLDRKRVLSCADKRDDAAISLISKIEDIKNKEVIVIFYGAKVTEEEAEKLQAMIEEKFPWTESGIIYGGQDVYDYIFAVE